MAVVDVVHTANIGHGTNLGIAFVSAPGSVMASADEPEMSPPHRASS